MKYFELGSRNFNSPIFLYRHIFIQSMPTDLFYTIISKPLKLDSILCDYTIFYGRMHKKKKKQKSQWIICHSCYNNYALDFHSSLFLHFFMENLTS